MIYKFVKKFGTVGGYERKGKLINTPNSQCQSGATEESQRKKEKRYPCAQSTPLFLVFFWSRS